MEMDGLFRLNDGALRTNGLLGSHNDFAFTLDDGDHIRREFDLREINIFSRGWDAGSGAARCLHIGCATGRTT